MKNKNIGWKRVLGMIIPYIMIVGFFELIALLLLGINPTTKDIQFTSIQIFITLLINTLGSFFVIWIFVIVVDKDKFINLGFHLKNRIKDILIGIFLGLFILGLGFVLLLQIKEINFIKINFNIKEILISIFLFLLVAFNEEVLIRGYILKNLMISFNKYIALVISSLLFALIHIANPNMSLFSFFDLFLAGIFLGISYIFTKNLWFPIALHFSWNLFQTFFGFNVSGQDMYSIIEIKITENNLLNGGDFGFEGSILSTIFQVIFIAIIWIYYRKQEKIDIIA